MQSRLLRSPRGSSSRCLTFVLASFFAAGVCSYAGAAEAVHFSGVRGGAGADFGTVKAGSTSAAISLVFSFDEEVTLGSRTVLTQGAVAMDFADAGTGTCEEGRSYRQGSSCTVDVTFTPRLSGARYGAAVLKGSSGEVLAAGYVQGTGLGPQVSFAVPVQKTFGADLNVAAGVAVDGKGEIYISDRENGRVVVERPSEGGYMQGLVVSGLSKPAAVAVDGAGSVYVADTGNNRVLKATLSAGSYSESTVGRGLTAPIGVAVDGRGNVYVAEQSTDRIVEEVLSEGAYKESIIVEGTPGGHSSEPAAVAVDRGGSVYVLYGDPGEVVKETPSGAGFSETRIGGALPMPTGIAVDAWGSVYIASSSGQIFKETYAAGKYIQSQLSFSGLKQPAQLAVDGAGALYIADSGNNRAVKEDYSTPPSLSFAAGSRNIETVEFVNIGNAPLEIPVPDAGANPSFPSAFTVAGGQFACPSVSAGASRGGLLAAGASCAYTVGVAPQGESLFTGALVLTDNNLNSSAPEYATHSIPLTVKPVSNTALGVSITSRGQGQVTTLTATVTGEKGGSVPTGTVTFEGLGGRAPVVPLSSGGVAVYTTSTLPKGSYAATATYSGDSSYFGSSNNPRAHFSVGAGAPASITRLSKFNPDGLVAWTPLDRLWVEVRDAKGMLVPGATVTYSGSGVYFSPNTVQTDASGRANTSVTMPNYGNFTVTASVAGVAQTVSFSLAVRGVLYIWPLQVKATYGQTPPVPTKYIITGYENGDTISVVSGAPVLSAEATSTSPAGIYTIHDQLGTLYAKNYNFHLCVNHLEVYKAPMTLTANSVTMTQGSPVPALTYTLSGFVNGDTASVATGSPILTTTATPNSPPGVYPITVRKGNLTAANYDAVVNFNNPAVTILPAK
jgi:streptogramin lyase